MKLDVKSIALSALLFLTCAASPAVSAPVGDFFGVGLGQMAQFESALFSNPEGRSLNCFVPMPFRTGKRLTRAGAGEVEMDLTKDGKFERADDWSSCAYFYLDRPDNNLPKLDAAERRLAGL